MRPGAATEYLEGVIAQFEQFASENYPPAIGDPKSADTLLLAGLRFVHTRHITDRQSALQEAFTETHTGKLARTNDKACLDALIDCSTNAVATAQVLADVGSRRKPLPTTELCCEGLKRLGPPAVEVLINKLAGEEDGIRRRKLALLLTRVSGTRMEETLRFWHKAEQAERDEAVERWRTALQERDKLPSE